MPVPTSIADCNVTASNNSPAGTDSIGTNLDDYLRAHAAILRQVYDASLIPSGTKMPFAQSSAPTGWTQLVTDNEDNRMLRVVKTAGGSVAGSHSPILNNVVPSHTHSYTTGTESAAHTHGDNGHQHAASVSGGYTVQGGAANSNIAIGPGFSTNMNSVLTSIGYASLTNNSSSHTHSGTVLANGSASDWTPRYIDMIICSKN